MPQSICDTQLFTRRIVLTPDPAAAPPMLTQLRRTLFAALSARVFYGWVVLAVSVVAMFGTGPGQSHLVGLFFTPIAEEIGLTRTSVAIAYGGATLFAAFLLPRVGRLVDRFGPARMLWIFSLGLGLAAVLFSFASSWFYVAVGFGFLRFLGQGAMTLNCINMVSQWFDRRRGFAMGLMGLGFPVSMAIHPPLCQWLIDLIGWRQTWVWLGAATWIVLLPPILLLAYSRPEEVGLEPDGGDGGGTARKSLAVSGLTLSEALRTPAFYIITASLFLLSMLVTALHVENKGILTSHGLPAQTATLMFTITGVTAMVSMPVVGHMLDRLRTEWMLAGGLIVMAASLVSVTLVGGLESAVIYAVIFGFNNGVTMTYFAYLWPRYFGRKHLGSIQGMGQMVGIIGASIGPLPLAISVDYLGGYDTMLRSLAILPIGCAVLALFLRAPALPGDEHEAIE